MTPQQWSSLRRGDILRKSGESGYFQVLSVGNGTVLLADHRLVDDPSQWSPVLAEYSPLGEPTESPAAKCRLCDGYGRIPEETPCPRCHGSKTEPIGLREIVVT